MPPCSFVCLPKKKNVGMRNREEREQGERAAFVCGYLLEDGESVFLEESDGAVTSTDDDVAL